ncbi:MAG: hypothetical protein ING44_06700 [Telmatospirillum sp.]|nr:hypothetical protein [Telmatospirillum sp.]
MSKSSGLEKVRQQVFDALLLNDSFLRLRDRGIDIELPRVESAKVAEVSQDFSFKIRLEAERMKKVYVTFFSLENSVRELIAQRLSERHGIDWWTTKVPQRIKDYAQKLLDKENKQKYLSKRAMSNVGYLNFGHLTQVIVSNWEDFGDLFPEQSWLTSRFNDLESCRNTIMHSNSLPDIEVARIESIVRDWLNQVG